MRPRQLLPLAALAFLVAAGVTAPFVRSADEKDARSDLVLVIKGHKEAVYGVTFSPDGKSLLTVSGEPSVKIFQAETGKEVKSFGGANAHKQLVLAVAVSPDGSQFATAGADNSARVWDFPSNKHLRDLATADDARAVAVTPDGSRVAGGSKDGKIRVWTAADGKQVFEITAHDGAVRGLAYSGNGSVLASVGVDGTLRYWNGTDGKALASFGAHSGEVTGLAHSPNTPVGYTCGKDGTLKFWGQPTASRKLAAALKDGVTSLSLSPDGTQIVAAADKVVRVAALATGATTREYTASAAVTTAALNPGGTLLAAGATDRRAHVWQTKDGQLLASTVAHGGAVTGLAFHPQGNQLVTVGKDGLARLWAVPPAPTRSVTPGDSVRVAAVSPDGKRLAAAGDKAIRLFKLDNLKMAERQLMGHSAAVNAAAFTGDGNGLVSGGDDEVIRFWGVAKGEQTASIGGHTAAITSVVVLGNQVISSSADGTLKAWATPAAAGKNSNLTHAGAVSSAVLSPDGAKLLTGCADKQVRLWNLATGQVERTWTGPTLAVQAVAFAPNGARVAAGSADKSVTVWEAASNKEVKKFANLPAAVGCVGLTADGKHAVAGLADGSVKVLDLATGKEAASLDGHKGAVNALAFTARGEVLYGGAEGNVYLRGVAARAAAATWKHGSAVHAIALNKDASKAAVGGAGKDVKVYAVATGKEEAVIKTPAEVRGVSYSADGKKLAVAGADGKTRVYSADGSLEEWFAQEGAVNAVAFAPDNKRVLTAGEDKSARVWATSLVWQARHEGAVKRVAVSPRGDRVLSAGADGLVRVWNAADGKAVQSIRAHDGAANAVAVTADSARIVTAGADKAVRVYEWAKMAANQTAGKDVDKAALQLALPASGEAVAVSPDGKRVAASVAGEKEGEDRVHVFDAASGKELIVLGDPDGLPGRSLAYLSDSRTLVAAGDKAVTLTDVNVLASFEVHAGGATGVAFHNNGTQALTAGADKTAKLWTVATGKLDRTFGPLDEAVSAVAFSRDGTSVAAAAGKALKVYNTADGKETTSIDMPRPASALSFSSDRTRVAAANGDGKARVYEVASKLEAQAFLHTGNVTGVAFHPTVPATLVSAGEDKSVGIHTLTLTRLVSAGAALNGLAYSPNQQHVLTAGADGKISFYNLGSGARDRAFDGDEKGVTCVAVSRNAQLVAAGGVGKKVRLFNYADPKVVSLFTAPAAARALAFSPVNQNSQALVGAGADGSLTTWDVTYTQGQALPAEFGKVLQSSAHGKDAFDVAFPTQGANYYTAGADRNVKAWKVASDAPTRNFQHPQSVNCVAFNKAGTQLATGAADGKLRVYDLAKGALLREITAHAVVNNTAIYCVAFSPDDKQVISGSVDQTLKLWNVADGKMTKEFKAYKEKEFPKGHQEAVLSVAFSPDGKQIATGSMDRTIKIWSVADGTVTKELTNPAYKPANAGDLHPAHPGWVYGLRWVNGGKKLVSAGQAPRLKGYLATWDPASGKLLSGKELSHGSVFALAVSPDEKTIALGTGGSVRSGEDLNLAVILKMPE